MFEKFTERARKSMSLARQQAQNLKSESIGTEHMLLGILYEGGGIATKALLQFKVDLRRVQDEIMKILSPLPASVSLLGMIPFTPRAKRAIELAGEEASRVGSEIIGTQHLLVGCLQEGEGLAAQILSHFDVTLPALCDVIRKLEEEAHPPVAAISTTPRRIRIVFYKKASDGHLSHGKTLFVCGSQYVEEGSLVVDGLTEADKDQTAAALATQRVCAVYLIEDVATLLDQDP